METILYRGVKYPKYQTNGNAARFIMPFAMEWCKGVGYDIGCHKVEWSLPGSIPIDLIFDDEWDAYNLPDVQVDYIFSSHCLEHLVTWVDALEYWASKLVTGGVLFLYLPDFSQEYWRPWNDKKHLHVMHPEVIRVWMMNNGFEDIMVSGVDMYHSFAIAGVKTNKPTI